MPRSYVSKVKLPGDTTIYYIKDEEARQAIEELNNITKYLGVAKAVPTTAPLNQVTILYVNPDHPDPSDPQHIIEEVVTAESGNVISVEGTEGGEYSRTEYIFNGSVWSELGHSGTMPYGQFAFVDTGYVGLSVTKSGTVTKQTKALSKTAIPVSVTSVSTDGAKVVTDVSTKSITYVSSINDKPTFEGTSSTITVTGTAAQTSATVSITNTKTAATLTKNAALSLALTKQVVTGGTSSQVLSNTTTITNGTSATATTFDPLGSITTTLSSGYLQVASVTAGEILQIYALNPTTVSVYGLAASNTKYMTGPESLSKVPISAYTGLTKESVYATVSKDTWVTEVSYSKATGGTVDINATVTASGSYTPEGSITISYSTSTADAIKSVTSSYAKVSAYAGGDTVVSGITDGITVALASSSTNTFTVYPSISNS